MKVLTLIIIYNVYCRTADVVECRKLFSLVFMVIKNTNYLGNRNFIFFSTILTKYYHYSRTFIEKAYK
jgi:hypothetical protein